jgi:hypothetical protein
VRFGAVDDALAVREGIEAMLSQSLALSAMPAAAALPANHLAALLLPPTLRRLYIARDVDATGDLALAALTERAAAAGIEALALSPRLGDFNEDLQAFGLGALRAALRPLLAPQDAVRCTRRGTAMTGSQMAGLDRPGRSGDGDVQTAPAQRWKLPLSSGGNRHEEPGPDMTSRHREAKDEAANLNIEATLWRTTSPM